MCGQQKQSNDPRNNRHNPQYADYWALLTRRRHIPPHSAQPRHTSDWAPRTRKRHQQEQQPQRPTERSDPTQHVKRRTGDCPGPCKETTTRRNVTRGGGGCGVAGCLSLEREGGVVGCEGLRGSCLGHRQSWLRLLRVPASCASGGRTACALRATGSHLTAAMSRVDTLLPSGPGKLRFYSIGPCTIRHLAILGVQSKPVLLQTNPPSIG